MINSPPPDIEQALLDVRRAYRLLHGYQRASLDAAKYIGAQLGFDYRDGYPRFGGPTPRKGKDAFACWAWAWLSFVHFDFNFYRTVNGEEVGLSIMLFSDTGIYLGETYGDQEPDLTAFADADKSKTKVCFLLFRNWQDDWDGLLYHQQAMRRLLEHDGELPEAIRAAGCTAKCFDFSLLSTERSTEEMITELIQFANARNYPLERIEKTVGGSFSKVSQT